jgi:hypothetical protein
MPPDTLPAVESSIWLRERRKVPDRMYCRETRRRNADGTEVASCLAHNERDPKTGMPKARIVHNLGRADLVDRTAFVASSARSVASSIPRMASLRRPPARSA